MKGSIRSRGKNTWQITIDLGLDNNGKRIRKYFTVNGKKGDAERKKRELLATLDLGLPIDNSKIKVSKYLEDWLKIKSSKVNERTMYGYRNVVARYANPYIGHVVIRNLQPDSIESMYAEQLKSGLSTKTVGQTHRILKQAFKHAVRRNIIGRNPFDSVDPPSPKKTEAKAFTSDQLNTLLENAEGVDYQAFYIAAHTGLRRGELVGLKWGDINFERKYLSVKRSIVFVPRMGHIIKGPKTESGIRPVDLSESMLRQMRKFKAQQAELQLRAGSLWANQDWVLSNPDGTHLNPNAITIAFKRLRDRLNLPDTPLHGLRHTHATIMLEGGIAREVVQQRLGHSSIVVTSDIYSHVTRGLQRNAAEVFEYLLINE